MIAIAALFPMVMQVVTYSSVQAAWLPLVFLAVLLDGTVVGAWYMIGYLLNNNAMKASARAEYGQFIGTGIMAVLVVILMGTVSTMLVSSMEATPLLNSQTMSAMCSNIGNYNTASGTRLVNYLAVLSSSPNIVHSTGFSFLAGSASGTGFPGLCAYVAQQHTSPTADTQLDYPLAVSAIILANQTNQTAANFQRLYVLDSYIGYQASIVPSFSLCLQLPTDIGPCVSPLTAQVDPPLMILNATYNPYDAYKMPYKSVETVGGMMGYSLEMFMAELVTTSVFLYIWPFLLFLGFVLRATPFTRKIGGLFIAIALGIVLIYPTVFAIEYLSSANGLSTAINSVQGSMAESIAQAYGFNAITSNAITAIDYSNSSSPAKRVYTPNFFVQPNIELVAQHYDCWPPFGDSKGPLFAEVADTAKALVPLNNVVGFVAQLITGQPFYPQINPIVNTVLAFPYTCSAQNVQNIAFAMFNIYGIIGMSAILLPIINVVITITAILGLSGLFGGDTNLAGLAKLV